MQQRRRVQHAVTRYMQAFHQTALRELARRCLAEASALSLAPPLGCLATRQAHAQASQPPLAEPAQQTSAQPQRPRAGRHPRHSGRSQGAAGSSPQEQDTERILESYLRLRAQGKHLAGDQEELLTLALARNADALHQQNGAHRGGQ